MPPDIVAVIVTYNSSDVIGDLLDSLPGALGRLTADVVVVDNGSRDGTADLVERRDDCRVIRSANTGYSAGINLGAAASAAAAILVLNADIRLHRNSVPPLLAALREPNVGIVAPQVRNLAGGLELSLRRDPTLLRAVGLTKTRLPIFSEYVAGLAAYDRPRTVDWALGAILLMSRQCYNLLGGWDESFFLYSEEVDIALRARDAGLLVRYEPRAVATHLGGHSGRDATTHSMHSSTGCGSTGAAMARQPPGATSSSAPRSS
ncbi:MAG TPA: glycosyltransferase family 2 protein [Streptosporangiaceae bacterium]|nr:glycosyltransferase family 2 protein [Streptosporangiaceae bacterium]